MVVRKFNYGILFGKCFLLVVEIWICNLLQDGVNKITIPKPQLHQWKVPLEFGVKGIKNELPKSSATNDSKIWSTAKLPGFHIGIPFISCR